jgi:hypothetical protein
VRFAGVSNDSLSKSNLLDTKLVVPQNVVHRAFPTETVLLNLNTGKYHGLNPTAGRMFELLVETGGKPRDVAARLAHDFELPVEAVEADLSELCVGLIERGLLEAIAS